MIKWQSDKADLENKGLSVILEGLPRGVLCGSNMSQREGVKDTPRILKDTRVLAREGRLEMKGLQSRCIRLEPLVRTGLGCVWIRLGCAWVDAIRWRGRVEMKARR